MIIYQLILVGIIKPTSSGRILNFNSNHPLHQKINVITNLLKRSLNLSSSKFHSENIKKVRNILFNNAYPKFIVNDVIRKYYNNNINNNNIHILNDITKFCKFPYIPGLSQNLKRVFKDENQINLVFYNIKSTNNLYTKLKDKIPNKFNSNLIYKIDCSNCSSCYIGQTRQYINNRLKQHQYDCKRQNYNKKDKTALSTHRFELNHTFDFDNVKILDKEINYYKRNISEMIYITLNKDKCVNLRTDTAKLSNLYMGLINKIKK